MMNNSLGMRITVVGTTGTGKTTLAHRLAQCLGVPHIELDSLYWGPNWTPVPAQDFRAHVEQVVSHAEWVVDGNYSRVREIVWVRTESLIWLDYSLRVVLSRIARRTFGRIKSGEELWSGNRETLRNALFAQEPLFVWAVRTHAKRRKRFELALQQPEYAHLLVIRHRSPHETDLWLANLVTPECTKEARIQA